MFLLKVGNNSKNYKVIVVAILANILLIYQNAFSKKIAFLNSTIRKHKYRRLFSNQKPVLNAAFKISDIQKQNIV